MNLKILYPAVLLFIYTLSLSTFATSSSTSNTNPGYSSGVSSGLQSTGQSKASQGLSNQGSRNRPSNIGSDSTKSGSTDLTIQSNLQQRFQSEGIDMTGINVRSNNGTVTLTGTVKNQQEANRAIAAARSINGVNKVNSSLTVEKKE